MRQSMGGGVITSPSFLQYSAHFQCILNTDWEIALRTIYCHPTYIFNPHMATLRMLSS